MNPEQIVKHFKVSLEAAKRLSEQVDLSTMESRVVQRLRERAKAKAEKVNSQKP